MNLNKSRRFFLQTTLAAAGGGLLAGQQTQTQGTAPAGAAAVPKPARIKSSVMIWTLKGTLEEKFAKVAESGIQSVELVSEYETWSDADVKTVVALKQSYNVGIDLLMASHDWTKRPVSMVNPAHREAFIKDVGHSIEWAKRLDVPQVILMSGNEQPGMTHEAQYASMVESGKRAAQMGADGGVTMVLENLNSKVNHPGYFLTSARESLEAVKEIDSPHLRMLFDIYHEQVQHGNPIPLVVEAEPYVNIYHVADAPGRHDPGTGEMKWDDIYKAIGKTEYAGYITLEYLPEGDEVESLKKAVTQMRRDLNSAAKPAKDVES